MKVHSDWEIRRCPCCDDLPNKKLEIVSRDPAESKSFEKLASEFIGFKSKQVFFSYYRCLNCGLLYCPYYFSHEQLERLYEEMPNNLMGEDKTTVSKTQSAYVDWIRKRITYARKFLEIGPDIGLFAQELANSYEVERAVMVEPNKAVHSQLQDSLYRVQEFEIVPSQKYISERNFDLIVGIHVYDHLIDPIKDLLHLSSLASTNSSLVIVVHNEKSILRKLLNAKWPPFCLQHPQLFNPVTLGKLLQKAGWDIRDYQRTTNWWHLNHFVNMGTQIFGVKAPISRFLPAIELPLKVGNFIARFQLLQSRDE